MKIAHSATLMQCTIFKLVLLSSTGGGTVHAEQVHAVYSYEDDFAGVFCAITGTLVCDSLLL